VPSKGYTVWSIVTSLIEEAILVGIVLELLPRFEVYLPIWALIVLMVVLGAYSALSYWMGKRALSKSPLLSLKALIGTKCKVETPLSPLGYVRIRGELWQAKSDKDIAARKEVVVEGVEGMTLLVSLAEKDQEKKE
jgi:membrane protein implicated in regulation of membrane protease activity